MPRNARDKTRVVTAGFGWVNGAFGYDRFWPRLGARHTTLWQILRPFGAFRHVREKRGQRVPLWQPQAMSGTGWQVSARLGHPAGGEGPPGCRGAQRPSNDAHLRAAPGAFERVDLVGLADQLGPRGFRGLMRLARAAVAWTHRAGVDDEAATARDLKLP